MSRLFALPLLVTLCAPGLFAQISISGPSSGRGSIGISGARSHGRPFGDGMHRHRSGRQPFFFGDPYFYSDYYDSYGPDYRVPESAPQPAPAPQLQIKNEPLPDPVLLELRGNQWVRVTNFGGTSGPVSIPSQSPAVPKETPPAVLVYRDGHTEDVSSYSIIGPLIYTKADYWTEGAWIRKIQIADLDIPATLKQNQQRGVKFDLPSGPNEVVIRP
jgi:hypothetical protein